MDKGSGLNVGEDNSVAKMMEEKAKLENEIATKNDFINQLEQQKTTLMERISRMENDLLREKEEVEKVRHFNDVLRDEKSSEERKKKIAEEEKKNLQSNVQEKDSAIDSLRIQSDNLQREVASLRDQLEKSEVNFANKNKEWQQVDYEKKAYEINFKQL